MLKSANDYLFGGIHLEALDLANALVDTVADKKAGDIIILDMREQSVLTDYFLLCSASNNRQIKAISEAVWDEAKSLAGDVRMGQEGTALSGWIVLDFGDLIVHVFSEEMREYYNLEELWRDGHIMLRMP